MCGIFAYAGKEPALPILVDGLKALEYRGYDSLGVYVAGDGVWKEVGAVSELAPSMPKSFSGTVGIAHTRWATHGVPSKTNAHPHHGQSKKVWLVHNGIIENYQTLKEDLSAKGHSFESDTDTEVLAHLIEEESKTIEYFPHAIASALKRARGTYGVAVMQVDAPDTIVVARMGSPIAIGVGSDANFIASDASALLRHTKDVVYLNDGEYSVVTPHSYQVFTLEHENRDVKPDTLEWDVEDAKKQGYDYFLLKEIMEGGEVLRNTALGRLLPDQGMVRLGGIEKYEKELRELERIVIVACGTASYAGTVGKYLIEEYTGIPVDVVIASEFRYRRMITQGKTAVIAVSQSGETADTLAGIKEAKRKGLLTLGIINVVGSTIAREVDAGVYNHAGPEISIASTKAYLSQIQVLAMLAIYLGRQRGMSETEGKRLVSELQALPEKIESILERREEIEVIAQKYYNATSMLFVGRKFNFASAYEGALKLKEISYIHAEGYGAGEMKHGPIALIDEAFPTFAFAPQDSVYEKVVSNLEEIKARKGPIIAVGTTGDTKLAELADDVFYIPETEEAFTPFLNAVPVQLLAYYVGLAKGYNVDRPRNLAKSVTVE